MPPSPAYRPEMKMSSWRARALFTYAIYYMPSFRAILGCSGYRLDCGVEESMYARDADEDDATSAQFFRQGNVSGWTWPAVLHVSSERDGSEYIAKRDNIKAKQGRIAGASGAYTSCRPSQCSHASKQFDFLFGSKMNGISCTLVFSHSKSDSQAPHLYLNSHVGKSAI